jgi:hypothetical protein
MGVSGAVLANAIVLAIPAAYALLDRHDPDLFYRSVQEDEWLEWASVGAFLVACFCFARAALARGRGMPLPWFLIGLSLFCFWVAMEEISWGQRIFGYRPPAYFLEHNYQQELNLHNVVDKDLRKLGLKGILLGYGVLLPLLAQAASARRLLQRLAVVAPPVALAPAFLAAYALYEIYPLRFSGEIVEAMMGLCFAYAGLTAWRANAASSDAVGIRVSLRSVAVSTAVVAMLATAGTAWSQRVRAASPEALAAARAELEALRADFVREGSRPRSALFRGCGLHKRLYTASERYHWQFLRGGRFARLVERGLPEERAQFLLDPWNHPYWIRDLCDDPRQRRVFLYSFGPNRRRDSTREAVAGDDLGATILDTGAVPD